MTMTDNETDTADETTTETRASWVRRAADWLRRRALEGETPDKALAGLRRAAQVRTPREQEPAYKDSTQFGVTAEGTFAPDAWDDGGFRGLLEKAGEERRMVRLGSGAALTAQLKAEFEAGWDLVSLTPPTTTCLPTISGCERVYLSFKPQKLILDEELIVTFTNASGDRQVAVYVEDAGDLVFVQAFAGAYNCFPCAPNVKTGVSGSAFSPRVVGNDISWPTVNAGCDLNVAFAVKQTVLYRATPPEGYTSRDITVIRVLARLNVIGPALR